MIATMAVIPLLVVFTKTSRGKAGPQVAIAE
jgi:hypothetical protein